MEKRSLDFLFKKRWHDASQYPPSWSERNDLLLKMLSVSGVEPQGCSFSEYGCGPHRPFAQALAKMGFSGDIHSLDMKSWQSDVIAVDLDKDGLQPLPESQVGVLSGVMEYLRQPQQVFTQLAEKHEYLLFSYRLLQISADGPLEKYSQDLAERAANGWKSHLTLAEMLKVIPAFGFVLNADIWRKQSLFLLKRWD